MYKKVFLIFLMVLSISDNIYLYTKKKNWTILLL